MSISLFQPSLVDMGTCPAFTFPTHLLVLRASPIPPRLCDSSNAEGRGWLVRLPTSHHHMRAASLPVALLGAVVLQPQPNTAGVRLHTRRRPLCGADWVWEGTVCAVCWLQVWSVNRTVFVCMWQVVLPRTYLSRVGLVLIFVIHA